MSKAEENMKSYIEKILEERRKDVKVVKHDVPYSEDSALPVYEVQYAIRSYDFVGHALVHWLSYGVFEKKEVADYVAEAIVTGVIQIRRTML